MDELDINIIGDDVFEESDDVFVDEFDLFVEELDVSEDVDDSRQHLVRRAELLRPERYAAMRAAACRLRLAKGFRCRIEKSRGGSLKLL